ncbi:MAG: gliding motility protein GldM [Tannerella sp.]|jgi:gliding motility-associated protein GldM|nr:gliding motility protein GldM [Tannerella sp.]
MGATNCPETPRQRMIGMMYLVLTAMLALNVSKDILSAFVVVDETLTISNLNAEKTIEANYTAIAKQTAILGVEKVGDAASRAERLQQASKELIAYIDQTRTDLLDFADKGALTEDGKPKTAKDIESKDNSSNSSNFFINQSRAEQLKLEIQKYRNTILGLVDPEQRDQISQFLGLDTEGDFFNNDGDKETWERHNFDGMILIATVTLMNKLIGEVKNAESTILSIILNSIGAEDFKFNTIKGRAIPKSEIVFEGENYQADIIVAAYDSKQTPEVYYKIGIDSLPENQIESATRLEGDSGLVQLELRSSVGDHKYAGVIKVKKPDGTDGFYHFANKYTVIQPTATIAAERMNVLYAGIENPLSVSASVPQEKLSVSVAGCNTVKSGSSWNVTVPASLIGREVTATVTANTDGSSRSMGTTNFRVKRVPDPYVEIGAGIRGGRKTKVELMANPAVFAKMPEDFVYELRWRVMSYRVIFVIRGTEEAPVAVQGGAFSDALKSRINSAPSGTSIYFEDIRIQSPAGERTLGGIGVRLR